MPPRAIWKGHLKIAEFACPVALYAAASVSDRVAFGTVNRRTGHPLRRDFADVETGRPVPKEDQAKGYVADGERTVVLTAEEVAAAVPESDKTLHVESFLACRDVDTAFFDKPYYLAPASGDAAEAFALMREGMREKGAAALARAVLFRRVRTVMIRAQGLGLVANTLSFDYEVRSSERAFRPIAEREVQPEMLELARHIIRTKSGRFDPATFEDRYDAALAELVRAKADGRAPALPERRPAPVVVDLMEALRQSAGGGGRGPKRGQGARKSAGRGTGGAAAPKRKAG